MRNFPWKAFAAGGLVLGVASFILRTKHSEPKARRVALIGDSYAQGLGRELKKLLPDFKYEGVQGIPARRYVVPAWVATFKPDLMLVSLGTNDGQNPDRNDLIEVVRQLHAAGIRTSENIVWLAPPNGVNVPRLRDLITTLGVRVMPAPTTPLSNLHPIDYAPWAREIAQAVT